MDDKRPNNQPMASVVDARGEAPKLRPGGSESSVAARTDESPASSAGLMEEICQRGNLQEALRRVQINRGSPGIDQMTVEQLPGYLSKHWPTIRQQLLNGTYQPQPVKRFGRAGEPGKGRSNPQFGCAESSAQSAENPRFFAFLRYGSHRLANLTGNA